jgi:hypothetical protein
LQEISEAEIQTVTTTADALFRAGDIIMIAAVVLLHITLVIITTVTAKDLYTTGIIMTIADANILITITMTVDANILIHTMMDADAMTDLIQKDVDKMQLTALFTEGSYFCYNFIVNSNFTDNL